MGHDSKYGQVTVEHERRFRIGEDEPVVLFRAKDHLLVTLLEEYHRLCQLDGCSQEHLDGVVASRDRVRAWQKQNEAVRPGDSP